MPLPPLTPLLASIPLAAVLLAPSSPPSPPSTPTSPATPPAAVPAPDAQPATVDLSSKLQPGQEHRYSLTIGSSMVISSPDLPGESQRQKVDQAIDFLITVKEADPAAGVTLLLTYEALKFTIDSANLQGGFDSAAPAPDADADEDVAEADRALRPLIGTVLTITVGPDGKVTDVEGGDALGGLDFWGQVAAQFAEQEIVTSFVQPIVTTHHPRGRADVGETWTHVDAGDSALGGFRIVTNHKLESFREGLAVISISGGIETVEEEGEGGAPSAFEIKASTNRGSYTWDTAAGVLKTLRQEQSVDMAADMNGMAMNVVNATTLHMERK